MFDTKEKISDLIKLLQERQVYLSHACQLKDLESYIKIGGIPSRALLTESGLNFTKFESDDDDKENGVWDKVFCNLQDLGIPFHMFKSGFPTPYGPILLLIDPSVLEEAENISICLRSAGAKNFDRESESLKTIVEVDMLFQNPKEHKYSNNIKFKKQLQEDFPKYEVTSSPEVSCVINQFKFGEEKVSTDYLVEVIVDGLDYNGIKLKDNVDSYLRSVNPHLANMIKDRYTKNQSLYDELVRVVALNKVNFSEFESTADHSIEEVSSLIAWVKKHKLDWMYERFAKYLLNGTLSVLNPSLIPLETEQNDEEKASS